MTNNHRGKACPFCQFPIKDDADIVVCSRCKIPHHRECWEENSGCTTFGCKETAYSTPTRNRVETPPVAQPNGQVASTGGGLNMFLVTALVVSLFVIIILFARITAEPPVKETAPPPSQQTTTRQVTTQTTKQTQEVIYYVITEQGSNLFIRKSPGRDNKPSGDIITKVPRGTEFAVINNHGNSVKKDGFTWWEIRVVRSGITGWVAAEYISTNRSSVRK